MLDLTERDFKIATINMSTELKESVIIEVKEGMTTVLHCIEDISEEIKMVKKKRSKWKSWSLKI